MKKLRVLRVAVLSNTSWYLFNFRLNLMLALKARGFEVVAVGPLDGYEDEIERAGIRHVRFGISGDGIHPLKELVTVLSLARDLRRERIDLVLSNTPKGNIYSAFASWFSSTNTIPNVSGLGRVFIKKSLLTGLVKRLYRLAFSASHRVFFQNKDDLNFFLDLGLVKRDKTVLVPGSGVDLLRFSQFLVPSGPYADSARFTFLLLARLLWDKGVGEYVEAAKCLRLKYPNMRCLLLGELDAANPSAIPRPVVDEWQENGYITYLGRTDDVRPYLRAADCVVLPSYREGTPRSLLEAAATGKPIITTNAVGCRNTVDDRITGFLCEPKNIENLSNKMEEMMLLPKEKRKNMGLKGRKKMEREFDERIVIKKYIEVVNRLKLRNSYR